MTITPLQWVSIGMGVLIAVGATFRIPALRTAPVTDRMYRSMRSWWPFGEALLRGWIRMTPMAIGGLWIVLAMLAVGVPSAGAQSGSPLYLLGYALVPLILMFVIWVAGDGVDRPIQPARLPGRAAPAVGARGDRRVASAGTTSVNCCTSR